ncbi:hypothetical protein SAMN05192555_103145 [Franzmannia pantelleriensis]|uniref:Uncharacterized protein n=1 Tax=Franzmannia pantelleriensis TaxID=48727 RepID=A0A1G9IE87_9GAMM|nr:hypothetical protein [Halomonas pantelleriensis]SDL23355.1 hypothetical protein SAMN05192555_103145 [Halomonas pantelleriensis]
MKYTTIIAQTIAASMLTLGLVAQAAAVEGTHTRVEIGSPAEGGTREGFRFVQVEKDQDAMHRAASNDHLPSKVGNPMIGGTREGLHRHNIEFVGSADNSEYSTSSDNSTLAEDLQLRTGTSG